MQRIKNQVRIIGGKWRGRKLYFPDEVGLRPTANRVRETLFNWLSPYILQARCLDLFAGSGSLGFEALSRGASNVVMNDASPCVVSQLRKNAQRLETLDSIYFYCHRVPNNTWPIHIYTFDIIFLDPPFYHHQIENCFLWLETHRCFTENVLVYFEMENNVPLPLSVQQNWVVLRQQKTTQVRACLVRRQH